METPQTGDTTTVTTPYDQLGVSLEDMPLISGGDTDIKDNPKKSESEEETKKEETKPESETTEEDGKPEKSEEDDNVSVFTATTGRAFKTLDELGKTYNESSAEGLRLSNELKTTKAVSNDLTEQLTEANKTILSLQEHVGKGGYPNAKTESEIVGMSEEDRLNYYADKREWKTKVDAFKAKLDNAKAESEAYTKKVAEEISKAESIMTADSKNYPEFTQVKPMRDKILSETPWLANRAETPYITYVLAQGLIALKVREIGHQTSEASRKTAASQAGGEATQTNKTGSKGNQKTTVLDKELDDIVSVYKEKRSGF